MGLTETARDALSEIRAATYELANAAGPPLPYGGRAQMVVDEAQKVIVGVTFVGPDAGEVHAATIAAGRRDPFDRLATA